MLKCNKNSRKILNLVFIVLNEINTSILFKKKKNKRKYMINSNNYKNLKKNKKQKLFIFIVYSSSRLVV